VGRRDPGAVDPRAHAEGAGVCFVAGGAVDALGNPKKNVVLAKWGWAWGDMKHRD